jgi:uncharacterized glyoxalase superfamily protein PhnB
MNELTPYLCVSDSRAAIDWYGEVFSATVQGKPYVWTTDGSATSN